MISALFLSSQSFLCNSGDGFHPLFDFDVLRMRKTSSSGKLESSIIFIHINKINKNFVDCVDSF